MNSAINILKKFAILMVLTFSILIPFSSDAHAAQTNSCPSGAYSAACSEAIASCSNEACKATAYRDYNLQADIDSCNAGPTASRTECIANANIDFNNAKNTALQTLTAANVDKAASSNNTEKDIDCNISWLSPSSVAGGAFCYIIKVTLLPLFTSFLIFSAKFFDLSVNWSIFGFADVFAEKNASDALYNIWKGVRDIVNIFVVFGLFFAAGKYIIGQGEEIRKTLARLIIFALLTNFSLPITKSVIDLTNVVGLNILGALITDYKFSRKASEILSGTYSGLSLKIVNLTRVQTLTNDASLAKTSLFSGLNGTTGALVAVFMVIAITAAIMQSAVLLSSRAVILFMCVVTSPLMFIHTLVPKFMGFDVSDLSERWRASFFKAALMAPVMFIMYGLAFSLFGIIAKAFSGIPDIVATGSSVTGNGVLDVDSWLRMASPIIKGVLMVVLIGYANKVSSNLCGALGDKAAALTGRATNMITGTAVGGSSSWALRKVSGYAAARAKNSKWVQDRTGDGKAGNYFTRNLGNTLLKSSDKILSSKSSLDIVRGTMNATNRMQSAVGINTYSYGRNRNELGNDAKKFDAKFKTAKVLESGNDMREKRLAALEIEEKNKAEDKNRTQSIETRKKYSEDLKVTAETDKSRIENIAMINDLRTSRDIRLAKVEEESNKKLAELDIQINKMREDVRKGLPGREPQIRAVEAEKKKIEDAANAEKQKIVNETKDKSAQILADSRAERAKQKRAGIGRLEDLPSLPPLKNDATEEEKRLYESEKQKIEEERKKIINDKAQRQSGMTAAEKAADDMTKNQNKYTESLAQSQERIKEEELARTQARVEQKSAEDAANLVANRTTEKFYNTRDVANSAKAESQALNNIVTNNVREELSSAIKEIANSAADVGKATVKTIGNVANPLQESAKPKENMEFMDTMSKLIEQAKKKGNTI